MSLTGDPKLYAFEVALTDTPDQYNVTLGWRVETIDGRHIYNTVDLGVDVEDLLALPARAIGDVLAQLEAEGYTTPDYGEATPPHLVDPRPGFPLSAP